MSNPTDLRYAPTHEWVRVDGDTATIGITAFAVEQLTEPTYLELPAVGRALSPGEEFGVIESVKSTSPIYAPVAGDVVERNEALLDGPGRKADLSLVNADPFGKGWLIRVTLARGAGLDHLLTAEQYDAQVAGH